MNKKRVFLFLTIAFVMMMGMVMNVSAKESADTFNYKAYADTYPDLKAAFGYNADALYNHYITTGKAEGRVGTFAESKENAISAPLVSAATEKLDPLPPVNINQHAAWFMALTPVGNMTNARLVAEMQTLRAYMASHDMYTTESTLVRESDLEMELANRERGLESYVTYAESFGPSSKGAQIAKKSVGYQKAMESDLAPLKPYLSSGAAKYYGL